MRFHLPVLIVAICVPTLVHLQSSPDTPEEGPFMARTGADVPVDETRSGETSSGQEIRPVYLDPRRRIDPFVTPSERRGSMYFEDSRGPFIRRYRPSFRRRRPFSRRRYGRPRRRPPVPSRRGTYRRTGDRRRPFYDPYYRDYERSYDSERYRRRRRYRPRSRIRDRRQYYPRDRDEDTGEYSPRYRDEDHRPRDEAYTDPPRDGLGYRGRSLDDERFGRRRRRLEYREGRRRGTGRRRRDRRLERDYLGDRSYLDDRPRDSIRANRSVNVDTRRDYRDFERGRLIDERGVGDRRLSDRREYQRSARYPQSDRREYRRGRYSSTDRRETSPTRTGNTDTLRSFRDSAALDARVNSLENYSPVKQIHNNLYETDSPGESTRPGVKNNLNLPKSDVSSKETPANDSEKVWPPKGDGYISNTISLLNADGKKQNNISSSGNLHLHGSDILPSLSNLESSSREYIAPSKSVKVIGLKENSIVRDKKLSSTEISNQANDDTMHPSSENSINIPSKMKNTHPKRNRKVGASNTFQKKHPLFMNIPMPTGVHSAMIVDLSKETVINSTLKPPIESTSKQYKVILNTLNSRKNIIAISNRTQNRVFKPAYDVRPSDSSLLSENTDKRLTGISKSSINSFSIQKPDTISSPLRMKTHQSDSSNKFLNELSNRSLAQDTPPVKLSIGVGGDVRSSITTQLPRPRLEPPVRSQKENLRKSVKESLSLEKTSRNDREPSRNRIRQIAPRSRLSEPIRSYRDERTINDIPSPERPLRDERLPLRRRLPPRERYREKTLSGERRGLRPPSRPYREGDVPIPERRIREESQPSRRRIPSSRRFRDNTLETRNEILTPERRLGEERHRRPPPRRTEVERDVPLRARPLRVKRPYPRRRRPPPRRFEDESDAPPLERPLRDERLPARRRLATRRRDEDELPVAPERPVTDERPLRRRRLPARRRPYRDDSSRPESDVRSSETPLRDERTPRDRRILRRRRPHSERQLRDEPRRRYLPPSRTIDEPSELHNRTLSSETGIRDEDPPLRRLPVSESGEEYPMPRRRRLFRRIPPESRPPRLERRYRDEVYRRRRRPPPPEERYREESRRRPTFSRGRTDRRQLKLPRRRTGTRRYGSRPTADETYPEDTVTPRRLRSRGRLRQETSIIESSSSSYTEESTTAGDTTTALESPAVESRTPAPESRLRLGAVRARGGEYGFPVHGGYCPGDRCSDGGLSAGVANGTGSGTLALFLERLRTGRNQDITSYKRDLGFVTTT